METPQPENHYYKIQEQLHAGLIQIVYDRIGKEEPEAEKKWNDFIISKDRVVSDQGVEVDHIHPDTLRALCHYAAALASESTNTAIIYDSEDVRNTRDGRTVKGIFTVWGTKTMPVQEHSITRPARPEVILYNDLTVLTSGRDPRANIIPNRITRITGGR